MNTTHPDYLLTGETITPNNAASQLIRQRAEMELQYRRLDESYAGASLADLFLRHPWLDAFTLNVTRSCEYDDQGSAFISHAVSVEAVVAVKGAGLPEGIIHDGTFSSGHAANFIENQLDTFDGAPVHDLPGHDGLDTISVRFGRHTLAAVLASTPVSGTAAFHALFPDLPDLSA